MIMALAEEAKVKNVHTKIGKYSSITSLAGQTITRENIQSIYKDVISLDPSYSYSYKRLADVQDVDNAEVSRRRAAISGGDDAFLLIEYARVLARFWLNEDIPERLRLDTTNELCPYSKMTALTAALQKALALQPDNANALALLGGAMRVQWKLQIAERHLTRASLIAPLDQEALMNRIRLHYRSGDLVSAERSCADVLQDNPGNRAVIEAIKTIRSDINRMRQLSAILGKHSRDVEKDNSPIIFIHFGYNNYLATTIASALMTNPRKRVILIGDQSNKIFETIGAEHYDFNTLNSGEEIEEFERIWKFIPTWDVQYQPEFFKFVFKKWYFVNRFIEMNQIKRFWHFDSDTMIMDNLEPLEKSLSQYDCTEQVSGRCMGGLISNHKAVQAYVASMNHDLRSGAYLDNLSAGAYNEMDAYIRFRDANPWLRSFNISEVHEGQMYEPHALGLPAPGDDLETEDGKKKFSIGADGSIYRKIMSTNQYVKIYAINMSWSLIASYEHMFNQIIRKMSR